MKSFPLLISAPFFFFKDLRVEMDVQPNSIKTHMATVGRGTQSSTPVEY